MCVSTYNYGGYVTDTTVVSLITDTVDTTVPLPLVCPIAVYINSLASQSVGWCQVLIGCQPHVVPGRHIDSKTAQE